jgi:hypothetical protein
VSLRKFVLSFVEKVSRFAKSGRSRFMALSLLRKVAAMMIALLLIGGGSVAALTGDEQQPTGPKYVVNKAPKVAVESAETTAPAPAEMPVPTTTPAQSSKPAASKPKVDPLAFTLNPASITLKNSESTTVTAKTVDGGQVYWRAALMQDGVIVQFTDSKQFGQASSTASFKISASVSTKPGKYMISISSSKDGNGGARLEKKIEVTVDGQPRAISSIEAPSSQITCRACNLVVNFKVNTLPTGSYNPMIKATATFDGQQVYGVTYNKNNGPDGQVTIGIPYDMPAGTHTLKISVTDGLYTESANVTIEIQ